MATNTIDTEQQEQEFRAFLDRQAAAEEEIHRGNLEPRLALYTREDPVTLFGAWGPCKSGWREVEPIFEWVASRLSDVTQLEFEVIALGVSDGLAYTVGYEHFTDRTDGGEPATTTLRVTHVYRREGDDWRIVHRHGDHLPLDQSPPTGH
jgi:ketosteroid isomerase-like protein